MDENKECFYQNSFGCTGSFSTKYKYKYAIAMGNAGATGARRGRWRKESIKYNK